MGGSVNEFLQEGNLPLSAGKIDGLRVKNVQTSAQTFVECAKNKNTGLVGLDKF
jgi:hypothetical protein